MTLLVIIFSAIIAVIADHYNTWYIAQEQAQAAVEDTPVLESVPESKPLYGLDAINAEIQKQLRLSAENEAMQRAAQVERETTARDRKLERLEFVIGTAEEKVAEERKAIVRYQKKLESINEKMKAINTSIEFYQLSGNVDKEIAEQSKKEKLEDQIFNINEKIQTRKERINKAQFTRRQALAELEEIA